MKKLYRRVGAILLPIAIYLLFFFSNDPYDFFGVKEVVADGSSLTGKMLDYRNEAYNGIIIGDSRIQRYNVEKLSAESGLNYINMAYGGSMGTEMNRLLAWCLEHRTAEIEQVILVTSFYNMNTALQLDRVTSTEKNIQSPLHYAFQAEHAAAMFKSAFETWAGEKETGNGKATVSSPEKKWENYQAHKKGMSYYLENFSYDREVIRELCRLCDEYQKNGVEVKIVLPPWWSGYYELLKEYGLYEMIDEYKSEISRYAPVYDFEFEACELSEAYDDFSDYSHFSGDAYQKFLGVIEEGDTSYCRVWEDGRLK